MPTKRGGYLAADGKTKLPSVTQVIGIGLGGYSKDALIHWAWKEGKEGRNYKDARNKAASSGTLAHALIEAFLRGESLDLGDHPLDIVSEAQTAFGAFQQWHGQHDVRLIEQEVSLQDDLAGYGGTFDALIDLDGVRTLADWKSSKDIYGSMVAQVGGYYGLIVRNRTDTADWPSQAVIVRFGKDGGLRVVTLALSDILTGRKLFNHALAVYEHRDIVDKMVAAVAVPFVKVGVGNKVTLSSRPDLRLRRHRAGGRSEGGVSNEPYCYGCLRKQTDCCCPRWIGFGDAPERSCAGCGKVLSTRIATQPNSNRSMHVYFCGDELCDRFDPIRRDSDRVIPFGLLS